MQTGGPFLFRELSIADAYFIPMALRFRTYCLPVSSPTVANYMTRIGQLDPVLEWVAGSVKDGPC